MSNKSIIKHTYESDKNLSYTKENFIKHLKKKKQQPNEHNLESITLEGTTFINVPSVRDSKTGKSLGFSSKTLTDLYDLLDTNATKNIIDFQKYQN